MTRRLVLGYLLITIIVLAMLEIPLAVFYSQREEERFIAAAERDAVVLGSYYEDVLHLGDTPDTAPAYDYAARNGARIVVVDASGLSVVDTGADPRRDFSTRPEVETALTGTRSAGIRHSDTLNTDLLYVAVPVASGGQVHGALRLTIDAHEVNEGIVRFWVGLAAVAVVVLLAVTGIGWTVARSVTRPLRDLQQSARRFAGGDLQPTDIDADAPPEVIALADAMNAMASRLDRLISTQRAFVSDASHQLRTPLTALRLRLENLETQLVDNDDMQQTTAAITEIERLTTLVEDLLQLARADQQPQAIAVDLTPIVTDRIDTWTAVATERDIALRLTPPAGPLVVTAIPGAIEQLLDNTIDNALRVSPPGSTVEVSVVPLDQMTKLSIVDHGPGLKGADKKRAVDRFWRGDTTASGTGLGLAIAQSVVEACDGRVDLTDTPGGGLTVEFALPAAQSSSMASSNGNEPSRREPVPPRRVKEG